MSTSSRKMPKMTIPLTFGVVIVAVFSVTEQAKQDVPSSYEPQWEGGCFQDCGKEMDAFCYAQGSRPMCQDCRMYCQSGGGYFSLEDCQSQCPAFFATLQTTQPPPALQNTSPGETTKVSDATQEKTTDGGKGSTKPTYGTAKSNNSSQPSKPTTPQFGKSRMSGSWVMVIAVIFFVLIIGLIVVVIICICKRRNQPPDELPYNDEGVLKQTAKVKCPKGYLAAMLQHWGYCVIWRQDHNEPHGVPEAKSLTEEDNHHNFAQNP